LALIAGLGTLLAVMWAAPASAATTCSYSAATDTVAVTMDANGNVATFSVGRLDQIVVRNASSTNVPCGVGFRGPTVENTETITTVGAPDRQSVVIENPAAFVDPTGADEAPGVDEVEFNPVDLGDSNTDLLKLVGAGSRDNFFYGPTGISFNGDLTDADIFPSGVEVHVAEGGAGVDWISADGLELTEPGSPFQSPVSISGGSDADFLTGGTSNDSLKGDAGADTLDGGFGADLLRGGDDFDTVAYADRAESVAVTISPADDTIYTVNGSANDENDDISGVRDGVASDVEALMGGSGDDRLTGDGDANTLQGGPGLDELRGLAGADTFLGGPGGDAIAGNDGADDLFGEGGNDGLNGGAGTDDCDGGAGRQDTARNCEATTGVP
jgi:Ca2+-binding RTX toxin-like protein